MSVGLWDGPSDFTGKSMTEINDRIRSKQLYAAAIIWTGFIICVLSIFIELVNGYCLGGGLAGVTWSALPHGVWQVPNLAILLMAVTSIYFDSNNDVQSTVVSSTVAMWFALMGMAPINIIHFVAVCFELNNTNSTFWLQSSGAWAWVLFIGLIVLIFWSLWVAHRLNSYRQDVNNGSTNFGWRPGILGNTAPSDEEAPPAVPAKNRLVTTAAADTHLSHRPGTGPTPVVASMIRVGATIVNGRGAGKNE